MKILEKFINPKYIIVKGVHINDRAVLSLIKVDYSYEDRYTIKDELSGKCFYKDNIWKSIFTFKELMYYGRYLSYYKTKPIRFSTLRLKRFKKVERI